MRRSVALPIASVLLGLLGALLTMPADTITAGAIRIPTTVFLIGLLAPSLWHVWRDGFQEVLRTEWAILYSLAYFVLLDVIQGLYHLDVARARVIEVFVVLTLGVVCLWVGAAARPLRLPTAVWRAATIPLSDGLLFRLILVCFGIGIFYYFFMANFSLTLVKQGLLDARSAAAWGRGSIGSWYSFVEHLAYFGYLLPPLTVLAYEYRRRFSLVAITGVVCSALYLPFVFQSGSRRILGMLIGSALFTWLCSERRRFRVKHLLVIAVTSLSLLVVMDIMLAVRNVGAKELSYTREEFKSVRVDDNFLRFAQILELIPKYYPHVGMQWPVYVLARPVPRVFWPGKPLTPGFDLGEVQGMNASLTCSSFAEWYMAFGWVGVCVGGWLYGRLAVTWSTLLEVPLPLSSIPIYSIGLMAMVVSVRSLIELILMSYPLLALLIVAKFIKQPTPPYQPREDAVALS